MTVPTICTQRLILRPWKESDLEPFAALNNDPRVMEFYASTLSREESDALAKKFQNEFAQRGYGHWAVEVPEKADFIGYIGLNYWNLEASFAPCIDIGWRLAVEHWGQGYATEGASAALKYGFEVFKFPEIVSMATIENTKSHRLMERLGMKRNPSEDFEHPKVPKGNPLSWRVLYRLKQERWLELQQSVRNIQ